MNRTELLSAIYGRYGALLAEWDIRLERNGLGAFVYLPEGYSAVREFGEVQVTYWTMDVLRAYLRKGGRSDDGLDRLLYDFEFGEEFLVLIIAYGDDQSEHEAYVHKITKRGLN